MHGNVIDLTGQTFERLTVNYRDASNQFGLAVWACTCVCGANVLARGRDLRKGRKKSCGCLHIESITSHGLSGTPEYVAYQAAKSRCTNPVHPSYENYGGRGIQFKFNTIDELINDVGRRPGSQHSLDRKDNNGHYEPGNVRWVTRTTQAYNKRSNRYVAIGDENLTVKQWANRQGIRSSVISTRLNKLKWCDTCAVTLPQDSQCIHREKYKQEVNN